jgi:hypothetical protein
MITETVDSRWSSLYRLGGAVAIVIAILLLGESVVYAVLPNRSTPVEFLALFRDNWFLGLLNFDLLGMIAYLLFIPFILSLYVALRRTNEAVMIVGTVLFLVGIAVFFSTNTAFPMLSLSGQYVAANTEAERAMLLAASQTMITLFKVNAFMVSYVIVSAAWLLIAAGMLRSKVFSKLTAVVGIMAGAAGIVAEMLEHISETFRIVAIFLYFAAIVFLLLWVVLSGRRLYNLGANSHRA